MADSSAVPWIGSRSDSGDGDGSRPAKRFAVAVRGGDVVMAITAAPGDARQCDVVDACIELSESLEADGHIDRAIAAAGRACFMRPAFPYSWRALGKLLLEQPGRGQPAIAALRRSAELAGGADPELKHMLAAACGSGGGAGGVQPPTHEETTVYVEQLFDSAAESYETVRGCCGHHSVAATIAATTAATATATTAVDCRPRRTQVHSAASNRDCCFCGCPTQDMGNLGYQAPRVLDLAIRSVLGQARYAHCRASCSVVELGCGSGMAGERMAWLCGVGRMVGIDVSASMLALAADREQVASPLPAAESFSFQPTSHTHLGASICLPPILTHITHADASMSPLLRRAYGWPQYGRLVHSEMTSGLSREPDASIDLLLAADVFAYTKDLGPLFAVAARKLRQFV